VAHPRFVGQPSFCVIQRSCSACMPRPGIAAVMGLRRVISQHAATVTSLAQRTYSLGVYFYSSSNLSRYLFDFRNFFTETRVVFPGLKRSRQIKKILATYFTGCKKR